MTLRPCLDCGEPTETSYCTEHRAPSNQAGANARGYDYRWQKLSERARRLQPFCLDCGTTEDLTVDHTPQAWKRKAEGKVIRLIDVAVVCRPCNSRRGRARPTGDDLRRTAARPPGKAQPPLHTPEGYILLDVLTTFDGLTDRELGFLTSCTFAGNERPTRERFRELLASGVITAEHFHSNVFVMRAVAPQAWGLRVVR